MGISTYYLVIVFKNPADPGAEFVSIRLAANQEGYAITPEDQEQAIDYCKGREWSPRELLAIGKTRITAGHMGGGFFKGIRCRHTWELYNNPTQQASNTKGA